MKRSILALTTAAAVLAVSACNTETSETNGAAQTTEAQEVAGEQTIAAGLDANGPFMTAAKGAGLDQTLAGPGPYTVLVPADAAFATAPEGTFDARPENRAQVTGVLTNLILPGTVLAADIEKAIEAGNGKAVMRTMGGGEITAARDGDRIVLTDGSGKTGTVVEADQRFTNGIVHRIDAVLMPSEAAGGTTAPQPGDQPATNTSQ